MANNNHVTSQAHSWVQWASKLLLFIVVAGLGLAAGVLQAAPTLNVVETAGDYYTITAQDSVDSSVKYWEIKVDIQSGGIFSFKDLTDAGDGSGGHNSYLDVDATSRRANLIFFDGRGGNVGSRNGALVDLDDRLTFTTAADNSSFTITYTETATSTDFFHDSYSDGAQTLSPGDLLTTITLAINAPTENGTFFDWTISSENVSGHDLSAKIWAAEFLFSYLHSSVNTTADSDSTRSDGAWNATSPESYIRFTVDNASSQGFTTGREFILDYQSGAAGDAAGMTVTTSDWAGFDYQRLTSPFSYSPHLANGATNVHSGQFIINIAGQTNDPPVADAGPDQLVTDADDSGSENVTLDGSGSSDIDGTIDTYVWKENSSQIATGVSPTVSLTQGVHTIELTATDDDGDFDTDTVVITVNDPPTASAGADQTVTDADSSGDESITLNASGSSDADGSIASYVWEENSSQIATGVNPTITLATGTHTVVLTVTDNDGGTATDTVVVDVNVPPVAMAGVDQTVNDADDSGSEDITLDASGSSDNDGSIASYVWKENSSQIATGSNPTISFAVGVHTVTLEVTDDDGAVNTDTVDITITEYVNIAPTADAGSDQTVSDGDDSGDEQVTLDGSGSTDSDGTITSYVWRENTTQIATGVNPIVTLSVGTHTIELTATDDDGDTDTDTVVVTVNAYVNVAPTANAGTDQTVTDIDDSGSETVTLNAAGSSDSDGTIASYAWEENSTQIATGVQPSVSLAVGTHTIDLTVTDDDGATDTDTIVVTVNAAPPAGGVPILSVVETVGDYYTITAQDSVDSSTKYWEIKVDVQSGGIFSFKDLTDAGDGAGGNNSYLDTDAYSRQATLIRFDGRGGNVMTRGSALTDLANRLTFTTAGDNSSFTITYTETAGSTDFFHDAYGSGGTALIPGDLLTTITLVINAPTESGTFFDWTITRNNVSGHDLDGRVTAEEYAESWLYGSIVKTDDSDTTLLDGAWNASSPESYTRFTIGSNPSLGFTSGRQIILDYQTDLAAFPSGGTITSSSWAGFDQRRYKSGYDAAGVFATGATRTSTGQLIIDIVGAVNDAPVADAGADQTVSDADNSGSESVTLDGSGSSDSDGSIANYVWKEGQTQIATGVSPSVDLTVGVHTITLEVTDDGGLTDSDTVDVTVEVPPFGTPTLTVVETAGDYYTITALDSIDSSIKYWEILVDIQSGGIFSFKDLTDTGDGGSGHNSYLDTDAYSRQATLIRFDGRGGNVLTRSSALTDLANRLTFTTAGDNSSFTITYTETAGSTDFFHDSYGSGATALTPGDLLTTITLVITPPDENGTAWDWSISCQNVSGHALDGRIPAGEFVESWLYGSIVKTDDSDSTLADGAWNAASPESYSRYTIGSNATLGFTNGREFILDYQTGQNGFASGGTVSSSTWAGFDQRRIMGAYTAGVDMATGATRTASGQFMIDIVGLTGGGNVAPVANAGADQTVTDADTSGSELVTLDGSGSSDSDGSISSYVWLENSSQIATGVSPQVSLAVGTHTITLEVTDDDSDTDTDTVVIVVNDPPVADAGSNQTVVDTDGDGSESIVLDGSGSSDSDGSIASYAWEENSSQIATGDMPVVSFAVGTHTVDLTVTDDDGATDSDTVVITVDPQGTGNTAPTAHAGTDQQVPDADDNGSELVTLDGSVSFDPDGSITSYVWEENSSQIATGSQPQVTLTVGVHTITLTVTDDASATDSDTVVITVTAPSAGTTYYVDFDGGSDSNNGTSTTTAWKHCPGDANATGTPASASLQPGDTVIFKGGVYYRGSIVMDDSGQAGSPIVYDGNTADTWGTGPAIIDGSEALSGWIACSSQSDCGGAAQWANMYKATLPTGVNLHAANLFQEADKLLLSQEPDPSDIMFYDETDIFFNVPPANATESSIVDSSFFTQTDANFWDGAYIYVWHNPNVISTLAVTGFEPANDKILFETLSPNVYPDKDTLYAMTNHHSLVDNPGEFFVDESTDTVYLWPKTDITQNVVSVSTRSIGIDLVGNDYITIQGFLIQKFAAPKQGYHQGLGIRNRSASNGNADNLLIQDNEIAYNYSYEKYGAITLEDSDNTVVENNNIHDNCKNKGILFTGSNNITFQDNIVDHNGSTGVDYYGCTNSYILRNTVSNHTGTHANGITMYLGNNNILVYGNHVYGGYISQTSQEGSEITTAYNLFDSRGFDGYTVAHWPNTDWPSYDLHYYNNIMLNDDNTALTVHAHGETGLIIKNNIIDGCLENVPGSNISHNIYTKLAWNQKSNYGWYLGTGEMVETDKTVIFVDPANDDFHLKAGSPAIDAGTDVGLTVDIEGNSVPYNGTPDIGPYEYQP